MIGAHPLRRRDFLRFSAVAGAVFLGGCGTDDAPKPVETPPLKGSNRDKLDKLVKPTPKPEKS